MTDEPTTQPDDVPPLTDDDFESWLAGARLPERAVVVYGRADLVADLEALNAEYEAARNRPPSTDRRMTQPDPVAALAESIRATQEQLEGSRRVIRVRAQDRDTVRRWAKDIEHQDEQEAAVAQVAAAAIEPKLTVEQARRLLGGVGWGQFSAIADAIFDASTKRTVTVPFSRASLPDAQTS